MSVTSMHQGNEERPLTDIAAEEVRALMARRGVTQTQLVSVLHVNQSGISKRLRGLIPFDLNEIGVLARFFDVDPRELLGAAGWPRGDGPDGGGLQSPSTLVRSYRTLLVAA